MGVAFDKANPIGNSPPVPRFHGLGVQVWAQLRIDDNARDFRLPGLAGSARRSSQLAMLVTGPSVRRPTDTLVQRRLLGNFSDQFDRGRVETCLLLFFGQILFRLGTAAMREAAASLLPFLRQPEKHQRKSRCSQRSPSGENKKPRRGARRVAMRPLRMFVRHEGEKIHAWKTKNACGY